MVNLLLRLDRVTDPNNAEADQGVVGFREVLVCSCRHRLLVAAYTLYIAGMERMVDKPMGQEVLL